MATAIDFEERNDYIGKPKTMTDNQCYALPVSRIITWIPGASDKNPAEQVIGHVSCWQLTEEEKAEILKTGKIYLKVLGGSMVPASLHGIKPIYINNGNLSDVVLSEEEIANARTQKMK